MEEVDKIILISLRQIGTELPEGLSSLKDLATEGFVEGCGRCINAINGNEEIPLKLPSVMSARFRHGTLLANACKALGYAQEIGYNTFLYANEAECRNLLMWLVERLPKENTAGGEDAGGPSAALYRSIAAEMARRLKMLWAPPFAKARGVCWRGSPPAWHLEGGRCITGFSSTALSSADTATASKERKQFIEKRQPLLTSQPPVKSTLASSVVAQQSTTLALQQQWDAEWNKQGLMSGLSAQDYKAKKLAGIKQKIADKMRAAVSKGAAESKKAVNLADLLATLAGSGEVSKASSFRNKEQLQFASQETPVSETPKAVSEEELVRQREEEEGKLQSSVDELEARAATLRAEIAAFAAAAEQARGRAAGLEEDNKGMETAQAVRRQVLDLLPNADENIAKLQAVIDGSAQRLLVLGSKWDEHRKGLVSELRKLKAAKKSAKSEAQNQLEDIKQLREEMKAVAEEARTREALCRQLEEVAAKLPADSNRSLYTRRILEIVRNISRQREDIAKVLVDTRALQKDISQLQEKLDRTFTVTDELVFKDAKKDEACRKAYKLLAGLHETSAALVASVEAMGATMRDIRNLEDQVDSEQRKNMAASLQRVMADLKQVKSDNAALNAQLAA